MPEINNVFPPPPPAPPLPPWSDFVVPQGIGEKIMGTLWNYRHEILDVAGMVPVYGEVFDVLNGVLYAVEGEYVQAGMSAGSAIPGLGSLLTGGKWVKKGVGAASDLGKNLDNVVGGIAKKGDEVLETCSKACFTEGTQIVVGMGYQEDEHGNLTTVYTTVHIEDIQIGDWVYSYNTLTGETEQCQVTSTVALSSDHINYLTIVNENGNEQVIETTDGHPFWVVTDDQTHDGHWVDAKDLKTGDVFLGANGELSTLTNIVRVEQSGGIQVFNFTVEGNHNYFILAKEYEYGQTCVLVHNANRKYKQRFECDYVDPKTREISDFPRLHSELPDAVPSNWGPEQIQNAIEELEVSKNSRAKDMARFSDIEPGHMTRTQNEEVFKMKLEKRLRDMGGGWQ